MSSSSQTAPAGEHAEPLTAEQPAALMRQAAKRLRDAVALAADGPWVTSLVWSPRATSTSAVYSHAYPTGTVESEVVASGRVRPGYGGIRNPRNAEYIALMQPAVGSALADWLEHEATEYEVEEYDPECPNCGEGCGGHDPRWAHTFCGEDAPCLCIKPALAVAQQILQAGAR